MVHYQVTNIETNPLVTVTSDARILEALKAMFSTGNKQIGVQEGDELIGIVSHQSITRMLLLFSNSDKLNSVLEWDVELAIEEPEPVIDKSDDIFTLFGELGESPYVLVDYGEEYHVLRDVGFHQYLESELEAFMLIEEIERTIRSIFEDAYGDELDNELTQTFESMEVRTPSSVEECSFAHYHIFISKNWDAFEGYFDVNRDFLRELLDSVGDIRNALFHYRSDAQDSLIEEEYIKFARDYLERESDVRTDE